MPGISPRRGGGGGGGGWGGGGGGGGGLGLGWAEQELTDALVSICHDMK